jgi:hypothetical protein
LAQVFNSISCRKDVKVVLSKSYEISHAGGLRADLEKEPGSGRLVPSGRA